MTISSEWARGEAHINGIDGFWNHAKTRMAKLRDMSKRAFYMP